MVTPASPAKEIGQKLELHLHHLYRFIIDLPCHHNLLIRIIGDWGKLSLAVDSFEPLAESVPAIIQKQIIAPDYVELAVGLRRRGRCGPIACVRSWRQPLLPASLDDYHWWIPPLSGPVLDFLKPLPLPARQHYQEQHRCGDPCRYPTDNAHHYGHRFGAHLLAYNDRQGDGKYQA
jgi:hypothetical protein